MTRVHRIALAGLAGASVLIGLPTSARSATPPANLAAADALALASPAGVLTRIPNELDGGALYSLSSYTLAKSQSTVAGFTPGPLGEAFLETTVVAPAGVPPQVGQNVKYKNPSLLTAQYPPSDVFPADVALASGGLTVTTPFQLNVASLHAVADAVSARSDATGGEKFVIPGVVTVQHAGSTSDTHVDEDGTVVAEAHSFLSGINIVGLLTIGAIESTARTTAKPGAAPTHALSVAIQHALLGGVPVEITKDGVNVAGSTLVNPAQQAAVNAALKALNQARLAVTLFPGIDEHADARSASAAGAAISIRYNVTQDIPSSIDIPVVGPTGSPLGDVGKDEEVLLGQVQVSALAAARGAPPRFDSSVSDGSLFAYDPSGFGDVSSEPSAGTPLAVRSVAPSGIRLAQHRAEPGVVALRSAYALVILCAVFGVGVLQVIRRRTLNS